MGEKGVVVVVEEMGEGMQCVDHPYRSNPGGICAFCLQEKLGKLVSSSKSNPAFFPIPPLPSSSSSSPPSSSLHIPISNNNNNNNKCMIGAGTSNNNCRSGRRSSSSSSRKVMASSSTASSSSSSSSSAANRDLMAVLKRSKSVAPRPLGGLAEVISTGSGSGSGSGSVLLPADSPRKKNFWSFLYHHSSSSSSFKWRSTSSSYSGGGGSRRDLKADQREEDHEESPPSLGRKVSRSRSVGCGSRSFSGDFLERISTGFGDCTLRRVESQREAKKPPHDEERMQRIKCGGRLFGMADGFGVAAGRMSTSMAAVRGGRIHHSRSSWGAWASFASPMRAFRTNASTRTYTVSAASSSAVNSSNNAPPPAPTTTTTTTSKTGSNPSMLAVGR